jgi:hypothetical protein
MQIDVSDEQPQNTRSSIRFNFEPGSKVTSSTDLQWAKHLNAKFLTMDGTQIDLSDEQRHST